jgi:hypothetical protein
MMPEITERISSVRKTKEEYLRERLQVRGISELVADLKISVSHDEMAAEVWKTAIRALKRKFRSMKITEETFREVSATGRIQVLMEDAENRNEPDALSLLAWATKSTARNLEGAIGITVLSGDFSFTSGYGVLNGADILKKHGTKWRLRQPKANFHFMLDVPTLLAEVLLRNSLWQYAIGNTHLLRRELARECVHKRKNTSQISKLTIPDPSWQELLDVMEEYEPGITGGPNSRSIDLLVDPLLWNALNGENDAWSVLEVDREKRRISSHICMLALIPFLKELNRLIEDAKAREESFASHARVWQLKKNIPQKTINRMQDNAFLQYFGSVELDADVDLEKFCAIEAELKRVNAIFPFPIRKNHSFRIRKLGNYRADGLYFPYHAALCVDLDGMSAYFHEGGHLIDYTFNPQKGITLSELSTFQTLYERYSIAVSNAIVKLPAEHSLRIKWFGDSKYNSDYYLRQTEVFARSFELYLYEIRGMKTSFLQDSYEEAVYPKDIRYLDLVKKYFDNLFNSPELNKVIDDSQVPVPVVIADLTVHPKTGQLMFAI